MEKKKFKFYKIISNIYNKEISKCSIIDKLIMKDPNNPCLFCNIKESGLAKKII